MINPNEAPEGFKAVEPLNRWADGSPKCDGCDFENLRCLSQPDSLCLAFLRKDGQDVIFVKETQE